MKQNDELLEQYEDAVFALLMDRVAQAEGNWANRENARLKEDPEAAVPEEVQRRCRESIHKAFSQKRKKRTTGAAWKILHHVAVIVLLLVTTVTVAFAAFPELRANVLNTILNIYDTYTDFSFEESVPSSVVPELRISVGWLPEGFELAEEGAVRDHVWMFYKNRSGGIIEINKSLPTTIGLDTENAQITSIQIQGYSATLVEKNHEVRIIWLDVNAKVVCYVGTEHVSVEDAVKISENIS